MKAFGVKSYAGTLVVSGRPDRLRNFFRCVYLRLGVLIFKRGIMKLVTML